MRNFSYALRKIIDFYTRVRRLSYSFCLFGFSLLALVATGFTFGFQIPTPYGAPLSLTFSTDAGIPAAVTYTITIAGVMLILLGSIAYRRECKILDRKRVFVIELRGLREWNGPPLSAYVPKKIIGRREDITINLRQGISDGTIVSPEAALTKIGALRPTIETRESGLDRNDLSYVFGGLAPVPLTFLAGVVLDDESPLTIMDWDRHQKIWRELDQPDDGRRFKIDGLAGITKGTPAVLLAISASYRANLDGAKRKFPDMPLVHLELENASTSSHWSNEKQEALSKQFLDTIMKLDARGLKQLHLVFAGPSSLVARFGSHYDKRNLPSLIVYQYEQDVEPPFPWGVRMPVAGRAQPEIV